MALPAIVFPASLPMWLLAGYESEPTPRYARAEMSTGHSRTRAIYTVSKRIERVQLLLVDDQQLTVFHDWYENDLRAGLERFSARFANLGAGTRWFDAQFIEPYTSTPMPGTVTTIAASLLLRGSPSLTGPT